MSTGLPFETRLQTAFDQIADEASVEVDAVTLAAALSSRPRRGLTLRRPFVVLPAWASIGLAILLLAGVLVAGALVASLLIPHPREYRGVFDVQPAMTVGRGQPIVRSLTDGRVLIAGGESILPPNAPAAELFDPTSGEYAYFTGDVVRGWGSAVQLPDGRVLAITTDKPNNVPALAYLLDPRSLTSVEIPRPPDDEPYPWAVEPSISLLDDGRVLVSGGDNPSSTNQAASLIFDPRTDRFDWTGSMLEPHRRSNALVTLADGRVLVVGGLAPIADSPAFYPEFEELASAEVFDPATGRFTAAGRMPSVRGRAEATLLPDGRALILHAGDHSSVFGEQLASVAIDVYDPATGKFAEMTPGAWAGSPTITALADGRLLLTGAETSADSSAGLAPWSAIYDPITEVTTEYESPRAIFPRGSGLPDGRALVVGGFTDPPLPDGSRSAPWVEVFE
jgi:hypothetical protein